MEETKESGRREFEDIEGSSPLRTGGKDSRQKLIQLLKKNPGDRTSSTNGLKKTPSDFNRLQQR